MDKIFILNELATVKKGTPLQVIKKESKAWVNGNYISHDGDVLQLRLVNTDDPIYLGYASGEHNIKIDDIDSIATWQNKN